MALRVENSIPAVLETLACYLPSLILRQFAHDPAPHTVPRLERLPAAVVFTDISGFTRLTEQLAQQGPAGAERLTVLLNTYFEQLIALITDHGGDVVKFAGDALIAIWPAEAEDL